MTIQMIIALAITAFMVILILRDNLPFGVPPLIACLLLVLFGVSDVKSAFAGFSNPTVIMLAEFMALVAAIGKTSFMTKFKAAMGKMASKGGFKAYMLITLMVSLGCSLFGSGAAAYYVMIVTFLSTLPYNKALPPSKIIMPAGFAGWHPLIPVNTAMQYAIAVSVLGSVGVTADIPIAKFGLIYFFVTVGFLINCAIQYKFLPDQQITSSKDKGIDEEAAGNSLTKKQEQITYGALVFAVVSLLLQSKLGDASLALAGLSVVVIFVSGVLDYKEVRSAISNPIVLMSAGVIGISDALANTGFTDLVGSSVANMLGGNVSPFILILAFCILSSTLATITGSNIGTAYVFAPLAVSTCINLGLDPRAAACAIAIGSFFGQFLPVDGLPAMIMGVGNYNIKQFWKFAIPQYFIRLVLLTAGALLVFPM